MAQCFAIGSKREAQAFLAHDLLGPHLIECTRLVMAASEKRTALEAANSARCTCGCGMTLAQCVSTDSTCPVREGNIGRIRTMVQQAKGT